jgi:hypothetical protein
MVLVVLVGSLTAASGLDAVNPCPIMENGVNQEGSIPRGGVVSTVEQPA